MNMIAVLFYVTTTLLNSLPIGYNRGDYDEEGRLWS